MIYELICFISSKIEEKQRINLINQIDGFIIEVSGKILGRKDIGERQLAYPIKKEMVAYNLVVYFELDGEQFKKLDEKLKNVDGILRFQIFRSKGLVDKEKEKKGEQLEVKLSEKKPHRKDILDI